MMFQEYALTSIPYLLNKFSGTGTGWPPNYKDSIYRIALRDDYTKPWVIAVPSPDLKGRVSNVMFP